MSWTGSWSGKWIRRSIWSAWTRILLRKRRQGEEGGIVKREAAIAACKVQVVCPKCNKGTRVAHKIEGDKKIRVCKHCGAEL